VSTQYNFTTGNVVMLGAAGGAGYAKRSNAYERPRWELAVKMDRGDTRRVTQDYEPALREGDRVRVYGTQVELLQ
jgi:outer membrane lipoprotein SlyB